MKASTPRRLLQYLKTESATSSWHIDQARTNTPPTTSPKRSLPNLARERNQQNETSRTAFTQIMRNKDAQTMEFSDISQDERSQTKQTTIEFTQTTSKGRPYGSQPQRRTSKREIRNERVRSKFLNGSFPNPQAHAGYAKRMLQSRQNQAIHIPQRSRKVRSQGVEDDRFRTNHGERKGSK